MADLTLVFFSRMRGRVEVADHTGDEALATRSKVVEAYGNGFREIFYKLYKAVRTASDQIIQLHQLQKRSHDHYVVFT